MSLIEREEPALGLKDALGDLMPGEPPVVCSYGVSAETLWSWEALIADPLFERIHSHGIVLIWGPEECHVMGTVHLDQYLNPLSWAVCAIKKFAGIKIAIVDVDGHANYRLNKLAGMMNPDKLPFKIVGVPLNLTELSGCFKGLQAVNQDGLQLIEGQIRALLTERGQENNHHALASIIGPLVLMGGRHEVALSLEQQALFGLFEAVGLIDQKELYSTKPNEGNARVPSRLFGNQPGCFFVVDDQIDSGWEEWVRKILKNVENARIEAVNTPDKIIEALEGFFELHPTEKDARFTLGFNKDYSGQNTILLLDLRLFALKEAEKEVSFVKKLLPLCRKFIQQKEGDFAWQGFFAGELEVIEKWCANPKRETDDHFLALSLFPRLISLSDFSLPIVLFSSTGQRRIIDLLSPYGNIITDFEKPRFVGAQNIDLILDTEARFHKAITKAARLLAARRKCRYIISKLKTHGQIGSANSPDKKARYVELFLDEIDWLRSEYFAIGGCFAVYEGNNFPDALSKADRFDDYLVEKGVRYFDNRGVGRSPTSGTILAKSSDISAYFSRYKEECADAPLHLGLIRLRIGKNGAGGVFAFDAIDADNRFHLALKSAVELFLGESLHVLKGSLPAENVLVSIFPGTRVAEIPQKYADDAKLRFGLNVVPNAGKLLFFSCSRNQVHPIVAELLDARNIKRNVYRMLAVQLPYANTPGIKMPEWFRCHHCNKIVEIRAKDGSGNISNKQVADELAKTCAYGPWQPDYRALHYLADEVLSEFPSTTIGHRYDALFNSDVPGEFDERADKYLSATLNASKYLDLGDIARAVYYFSMAPKTETGKKPRASYWLQIRLAEALFNISGKEFLRVAS